MAHGIVEVQASLAAPGSDDAQAAAQVDARVDARVDAQVDAPDDAQADARADAWMREAALVLRAAACGDLEERLGAAGHAEPPAGSAAAELYAAVDDALDRIDAYVRESRAALAHASREEFWRRVVLTGMPGGYRQAAIVINAAARAMQSKSADLCSSDRRRSELAGEFDAFVREVVASVSGAANRLDSSCRTLAGSAERSFSGLGTVAEVARTLSTDVASVAAATEELSATAGEIRRQVQDASGAAHGCAEETRRTQQTIAELAQASERIGNVVDLISVIASQTKLLALNASIEAARAGAAGRGFAVVAGEVKKLAQETARATAEIVETIASVQAATGRTVESIARVGEQLARLEQGSQSIAASVDQQALATDEISTAVQRTALGSNSLSETVADLSGNAEATRSELGSLQQSSGELRQSSSVLEERAGHFLRSVRGG